MDDQDGDEAGRKRENEHLRLHAHERPWIGVQPFMLMWSLT
jgi:hypothetical protein